MIESSGIRKPVFAGILMLALTASPMRSADKHQPPPVQPANSFAAFDEHAADKVTVAAEPYDTKEKAQIFHVDFLRHGILPVRLIVTNNGDKPISLRDARILFVTAAGERIQAAEPEDVERRMSKREREGSSVPLPIPLPLPSARTKPKGSNTQLEADFDLFEFSALVVEAHTTRAGFLFYDVSQLAHPLQGAKLQLTRLRDAKGQELFYFEIPFATYLQSKSKQMN